MGSPGSWAPGKPHQHSENLALGSGQEERGCSGDENGEIGKKGKREEMGMRRSRRGGYKGKRKGKGKVRGGGKGM